MIPTLANHLLQSTLFAAVAGCLTLLLRNNHARTRYWLWFAASMKFLVPFALFVEIGRKFSWQSAPVITVQPQVSLVFDQISQPFATFAPVATPALAPSILPSLLLAAWAIGAGALLIFWFARWRRVAQSLRSARPLNQGREFESLQRLNGETKLLSSTTSIEPGVFGILRPVLTLPAGIADNLDDAELDAILAHELCHIRRRDNLTAAFHMLIEAIFWFHPLVWWVGAKLVEERERACDEEVVRLGGDPEVYAESILKICRYYLASPLTCAAGISGSDLKQRIESIMANPTLCALSPGKKLLLSFAATLALIAPVAAGIVNIVAPLQMPWRSSPPTSLPVTSVRELPLVAQAAPPFPTRPSPPPPPTALKFEVASIHENPGPTWHVLFGYTASGSRLTLEAYPPLGLITEAYELKEYQVVIPPPLRIVLYTYFDIAAKAGAEAPTRADFRQMLRTLLVDRFAFRFHYETREMQAYALVVGKSGPKFKETDPEAPAQVAFHGVNGRNQYVKLTHATLDMLTDELNHQGTGKPIFNETGLTGQYDLRLEATPSFRMNNNPQPHDITIFTAIQEQLGLKLEEQKRPVDVMVIDSIAKPSEN